MCPRLRSRCLKSRSEYGRLPITRNRLPILIEIGSSRTCAGHSMLVGAHLIFKSHLIGRAWRFVGRTNAISSDWLRTLQRACVLCGCRSARPHKRGYGRHSSVTMIQDINEPLAHAVVTWVTPEMGRSEVWPPSGPVYAATSVFVHGGEAEVHPGWPLRADQLSILIQLTETLPGGAWLCKIDHGPGSRGPLGASRRCPADHGRTQGRRHGRANGRGRTRRSQRELTSRAGGEGYGGSCSRVASGTDARLAQLTMRMATRRRSRSPTAPAPSTSATTTPLTTCSARPVGKLLGCAPGACGSPRRAPSHVR